MKRLLLTSKSKFFYENLQEYVDKPLEELKVVWVTTAGVASSTPGYLDRHRGYMSGQPFSVVEFDIEGKSEEELRSVMEDVDVIFVLGGNTFHLLKTIKETAFEKVAKEKISEGVLYVGSSAGAYVTCPNIEVATWKGCEHTNKPYPNQDLTAMGWVPFLIRAHYVPEDEGVIRNGVNNSKYDLRVLTDEQALLVEDEKVTLLGEGEEIKFH